MCTISHGLSVKFILYISRILLSINVFWALNLITTSCVLRPKAKSILRAPENVPHTYYIFNLTTNLIIFLSSHLTSDGILWQHCFTYIVFSYCKNLLKTRNSLETYSKEMKNLTTVIFGQMEMALKIENQEIRKMLEDGLQSMRMNYYPPCPNPEKVIGLSPHSDGAALTILLQISDVEGLQVKNKDKWVPVKPLSDAFIVNVGDFLEIITNGTYKSIEHRATVNNKMERLSMATFWHPCFEGEVQPARSLINDQTPPVFAAVKVEDFYKDWLGRELKGKSFLDSLKIQ